MSTSGDLGFVKLNHLTFSDTYWQGIVESVDMVNDEYVRSDQTERKKKRSELLILLPVGPFPLYS